MICPSGKRRYRRRRYAIRALRRIQSHGMSVRTVYRCPDCDGFHLTSRR